MNGSVTALLVSHDGERWLPSVLRQLTAQSVAPDRLVAVDTGSVDRSVELLRDGAPTATVVELDRSTTFPAAVRAGLAELSPAPEPAWVWLLHDDSAPAPDALERLLAAADADPDLVVLGPKIREWPSLRRLVEVGVTITGTGQRETGLERGEYDQGQHDTPRDVLAVNTAGMLVRRATLEELGLDDQLPLVHTDVDFGWRAARAGHRVRVVPGAVLFHAEGSRSGLREPGQSRSDRRRRDREASLHTVLTNCRSSALPFLWCRLVLGTLLRALGLVLLRAPAEGWAELRALAATAGRPGRILHGRRWRSALARVSPRAVRPLLASPLLPYRHGIEELTEIGSAVVREAAGASGDRSEQPSWHRRFLRSPGLWVVLLLTVATLVAARGVLGSGRLAGGALLPAPDSATDWLRHYVSTAHHLGTGSTAPAPTYLLALGVLGAALLGAASLVVDLLVLGAVPLAAVGGYRFLFRLSRAPWSSAWGAATYAVLLALGGAVAQGRVGTLAAAVVLPWLATSALGLVVDDHDRQMRAAWRTALWLALAAAFAPLLWWLAAAVALLALLAPGAAGLRGSRLPVGIPVPVAALLLLPWSAQGWAAQGASAVLLEAGLPASQLLGGAEALDVLGGRSTLIGAGPVWTGLTVALLATLALVRRDTLLPVLRSWSVALLALVGIWVLSGLEISSPSGSGTELVWVGLLVLVLHGAWLTAAVVASSELRASLAGRSFGWRQPAVLAVVLVAVAAPVLGAGWLVLQGIGDPMSRVAATTTPVFMADAADRDPADGTLLLRGTSETGYDTELQRGHPLALGEAAILPATEDQAALIRTVRDLVTTPGERTVSDLAAAGVAFVFAPEPVDPRLAGILDATPRLAPASEADIGGRAWRLEEGARLPSPPVGTAAGLRPLWLFLQALTLVTVVVLAAPTRRREP